MPDPHSNFGYSTVLTAPSPASSGTSLVVQSGDGAKFPSTGSFNATVWPASAQPTTANAEIVRVTIVATDTFTITRTQEGTSARTIVVGDQIANTVTVRTLTDLENTYVTAADQTIQANTQILYDDYLELAASFVYELASGAILVIGDYATPLPAPDQNPSIFITVADETIPTNSEVVFSEFYELSAPFAVELSRDAVLQLGTVPSLGSSSPFLPGYEFGYDQITATVNVIGLAEGTPTTIITCAPHYFDGAPVIAEFNAPEVNLPIGSTTDKLGISLWEGAEIGCIAYVGAAVTAGGPQHAISVRYRFTPTAGIHAYSIRAFASSTTGTPAIVAGPAGANNFTPAYIRFTKV